MGWNKAWGGMDTGMVKMAPMTNMPDSLAEIANNLAMQIEAGELDIFPGKSIGDLLGMGAYVEGIDAIVPN